MHIEPHTPPATPHANQPPHTPWCANHHGEHGQCRRVVSTIGPLIVGLDNAEHGETVIRLVDPVSHATIAINAADATVLVEVIGQAQRHLGAGIGTDPAGLPTLDDGFDADPLVCAAVRTIRTFCGVAADHGTAAEAVELCVLRDELDDDQLDAVLARFPHHVVAERGA